MRDDPLVHVASLPEMFGKWDDFLSRGLADGEVEAFRCHAQTERPLGADSFIGRLENVYGRIHHKQKHGPKGVSKEKQDFQKLSMVSPEFV